MPHVSSGQPRLSPPDRDAAALDRGRRRVGAALGLHPARATDASRRRDAALARGTRSTPSSSRGSRRRACALRPRPRARELLRRLSFDLTGLPPTPEEVRAFETDTREGRLRAPGRPPARFAPLRRAHGALLAGPRALLGQRRLPQRQRAPDVALPRLGGQAFNAQPAVRPLHGRAARGRSAARTRSDADRSRPATTGCCRRPRRAALSRRSTARSTWPTACATPRRLDGRDPRLRAVPRPQVRPVPGAGLLQPSRPSSPTSASSRSAAASPTRFPTPPRSGPRRADAEVALEALEERRPSGGGAGGVGEGARARAASRSSRRSSRWRQLGERHARDDPGQRLFDHRLHLERTEASHATPTPSASRPTSRASRRCASRR